MNPWSWNLLDDVRLMLSYPFMVNAVRAGTIVAVVAGAVGYVMVLRRQSFAGHTLAVIGFPGAAGALWLGLDPLWGYFAFGLAGALVVAALPDGGRAGDEHGGAGQESALIGTVQAFALACGLLFASLTSGFVTRLNSLLFGTIVGVTERQVWLLLAVAVPTLVVLAVGFRPLLFTTVDPVVARARGVPVRLVSVGFLLLLAATAAGTAQVTGSLLVFALLVAPAAVAVRLTTRPGLGVAVAVTVALLVTWVGDLLAFFTAYPIGFWVTTLAFGCFVAAGGVRRVLDWRRDDRSPGRRAAPASRRARWRGGSTADRGHALPSAVPEAPGPVDRQTADELVSGA